MNLLLALLITLPLGVLDVVVEAEDARLVGVTVDTTRDGYSGSGYVTGFDAPTDSLTFTVDLAQGVHEVWIASAQSGRSQRYTLWIDGEERSGDLFGSAAFVERRLAEVWLAGGTHTITFQGDVDADYLRIVPVDYAPPAPPDTPLSDPEATASARALYAFLKAQYGEHILSGQQELRDVDYIAAVTGRTPAIAGGDLIEYSPSRWERGARPRRSGYASVEDLITWADRDGIVALMWHWNAPTDLLDTQDQPWWRGFYTEATTFDFAAALADTSSEAYALLLRDIDAIAVQLRKLADADVPVLWRPLHEAAGGWFWWGARGPGPFVELWRLLYDRLVHHHELHHLVWVYTHEPGADAWYPGDDVVDVVAIDVYANDPAALMRDQWEELQERFGDRKLLALSESGTLPDPDVITDFGVWWNWMALWSDAFVRGLDPDYLRAVFTSEVVLTRDELPAWRRLDTAADPAADPAAPVPPALAVDLAVYPNPTSGGATLRLTLPHAGEVVVEVYDALGRRVQRERLGVRPAGEVTAPLAAPAAAGVYAVRVRAGGEVYHGTFVAVR